MTTTQTTTEAGGLQWLGTWNGWRVLWQDGHLWLVNPLTGHRRSCAGTAAAVLRPPAAK